MRNITLSQIFLVFLDVFSLAWVLTVSRSDIMQYGDNNLAEETFEPPRVRKGKKFALGITVTKDGPYLDGAAVLVQSLISTNSELDFDIIAITHPGVVSTRQPLINLGFKIYDFEPPVSQEDIKGTYLKDTIEKFGCCGSLELLKICAFKLHQYERVLLLDMDTLLLQNVDHIFSLPDNIALAFTNDHAMDNKNSKAPPVQGGFLLVKPDNQIYSNLVDIVIEGDFRPGSGWGGVGIGWCWGGRTIQGLLAYYFHHIAPERGYVLDDCLYNAMDTVPERCNYNDTSLQQVKTVHFTVCQKPWECHKGKQGFCEMSHTKWWDERRMLENRIGQPNVQRCCRDKALCGSHNTVYKPLKLKNKLW